MSHSRMVAATAALLLTTMTSAVHAQGSTSGLFVGAHVTGAGLNFGSAAQKVDFGGGWGLRAGVGLGESFTILANYDRNNLDNASGGGSYDIGQYDLLARLNLMDPSSVLRPYLTGGITGRVAKSSTFLGNTGDYKFSSTSPTLGLGTQLFLTRALALDAGAMWTFGDLKLDNNSGPVTTSRYSSTGTRVMVGVTFYPMH